MDILDYYKAQEMMIPSLSPRPPRGTLGAAANTPVFTDAGGNPISSIQCGQSFGFDVPGYKQVWMTQVLNGNKIFDGLFNVPMPPYLSDCANVTDVGIHFVTVYDPVTGIVLGTTNFTVYPANSGGPVTGGPGGGTGPVTPGPVTASASFSPGLILAGLAALWLLS